MTVIPNSAADAFNIPHRFHIAGREYVVRRRTNAQIAEMENWLELNIPTAVETLRATARRVSDGDEVLFRELIKENYAKAAEEDSRRDFTYFSPLFRQHMSNQRFIEFQFQLALGLDRDEVLTLLLADDTRELGRVLSFFHHGVRGLEIERDQAKAEVLSIVKGEQPTTEPDPVPPGNAPDSASSI